MKTYIISLFVWFLTAVLCQELRILPEGDKFTRSLGSNIVFTCEVYRLGPQTVDINLRWFDRDGREILETGGPGRLVYVEKEENLPTKKLYFTHIRNEHAGTYSCSGIIGGNQQELRIQLLLFQEITFVDAKSPQYPILHTSGFIICRVTGQPVPTVSWRYRGQKITSSSSYRYAQDQFGLVIRNVTKDDEGIYTCRAEVDADGRYDERPINVIVYVPPKVTTKSVRLNGTQSQEFALRCGATGDPAPKFDFTKDGNLNPMYTTDRVYIDRDSGHIHFRPLHKEDEGVYNCKAFNNAGEDFGELNLTVFVPPTVLPIFNMTQQEGLAVTLVCNSYGDPPPSMTFRKAGNVADYTMGDNNENGRIIMSNPSAGRLELVIRNLIPEDMANYTCKSSNIVGYHEKNGTITVLFKPRFPADQVKRTYIWPGKTRNITCRVLAEPMPSITWSRFTYALRDNETFRIYNMGKNSNLQVTAREYDVTWLFGDYTCKAKNQYGESEMKIELARALVPGQPKSVTVLEKTSDLVILGVEPPDITDGENVIGYRLTFENIVLEFTVDDIILVEHLRPSTTFLIRIFVRNEVGLGNPFTLTVTMDDVKPPSELQLKEGTSDKAQYTIIWAKPITGGRPIREYEFKFRTVDHLKNPIDDWKRRVTQEDEDQPRFYYRLEGLLPGTAYELEVRARNDIGWSPVARQFFSTDPDFYSRTGEGCRTRVGLLLFCFAVILALLINRSEQCL